MFVHTQSEQSLTDSLTGEDGKGSAFYHLGLGKPMTPAWVGGGTALGWSWPWASFRTYCFLTLSEVGWYCFSEAHGHVTEKWVL